MNMIYAALLCYANGNCIIPNGPSVYIYFNTLAACERQIQIENQGHLRNTNMRAVCFEKPGWQPVHKPSYSDVPPPDPCARLSSDALATCREQEEKDINDQIEREWRK